MSGFTWTVQRSGSEMIGVVCVSNVAAKHETSSQNDIEASAFSASRGAL